MYCDAGDDAGDDDDGDDDDDDDDDDSIDNYYIHDFYEWGQITPNTYKTESHETNIFGNIWKRWFFDNSEIITGDMTAQIHLQFV